MYFLEPFINLPTFSKYIVLFLCAFGAFWFLEGLYITYKYIREEKDDNKKLDYTITQVDKELSIIDNKIKEKERENK